MKVQIQHSGVTSQPGKTVLTIQQEASNPKELHGWWLTGIEFLLKDKEHWPNTSKMIAVKEQDPEIHTSSKCHNVDGKETNTSEYGTSGTA